MELFHITQPTATKVPIILSVPHAGTYFPEEIATRLHSDKVQNPDDTDWYIDKLYDFAPSLGITVIKANYSRWVIDLNRDPESKPLYTDGRVITGLVPLTNFNGEPLYQSGEPDEHEIAERVHKYYIEYHEQIEKLLEQTKTEFGKALLFDAHSIRKVVPGIQEEAFPDLILGDNDGKSASEEIINTAWEALQNDRFKAEHNHPFKGGQITRSFGKPESNIHALQLEMAKTNYMDASETKYDEQNAAQIRQILKTVFEQLIKTLQA
ncbi:N-formylglutamate deformylase [Flavobacterium sp. Sd200]|uniref:N-formylglutamate amidohydrolase n=1 Tax=Flavobacterium sp. Sd200 TaxID=2692211 RepID=UPI001370E901|nr:N-formylglutamate amidohydrolase [Flavobacterium sp. Sd200]MXN92806.1 N-formylglutamate deformylase [Flavobacterium sp. Sd200]